MNKRYKQAFTLLELLVVLVIISVVVTFALLAFGDFGQERKITAATRQLSSLIKLAHEQALLEPAMLSISFEPHRYYFSRLNMKKQTWDRITKDHVLRPRRLPKGMEIVSPKMITFTPAGSMTAFTFEIKPIHVKIIGSINGEVTLIEQQH